MEYAIVIKTNFYLKLEYYLKSFDVDHAIIMAKKKPHQLIRGIVNYREF